MGEKHTSVWRRVLKSLSVSHSLIHNSRLHGFSWKLLKLFALNLDGHSQSLWSVPGKHRMVASESRLERDTKGDKEKHKLTITDKKKLQLISCFS